MSKCTECGCRQVLSIDPMDMLDTTDCPRCQGEIVQMNSEGVRFEYDDGYGIPTSATRRWADAGYTVEESTRLLSDSVM